MPNNQPSNPETPMTAGEVNEIWEIPSFTSRYSIIDETIIRSFGGEEPPSRITNNCIVILKHNQDNIETLQTNNMPSFDMAMARVLSYKQETDRITKIQWLGQDPKVSNVNGSRFRVANAEQVDRFETLSQYPQLRIMPVIGYVVAYNGLYGNRGARHTRGVVLNHSRRNQVQITWLSGTLQDGFINLSALYAPAEQAGAINMPTESLTSCSYCGSQRQVLDSVLYGEHRFCDRDCANSFGWHNCSDCSFEINQNNSETMVVDNGERVVCRDCFEGYARCVNCGAMRLPNRMRVQDSGELMCDRCHRRINRNILDHSHKPRAIFNKMAWENTRYVGIELEIELDSDVDKEDFAINIKRWLKQRKTLQGKPLNELVYLKEDGSLEHGFEIVFHPFTLKSLHKNFPIKDFLLFLNKSGATSFESGRCGHHVHVTKGNLSHVDLLKAKWFFVKCHKYIAKFSGRENFSYCHFEDKMRRDPYDQPHGKYSAFNVAASMETVEFRVFRGTLNYLKFMANLQFSEATIDFVQHIGAAFVKTKYPAEVWQEFIDYSKRTNQFKILTDYILQHSIV